MEKFEEPKVEFIKVSTSQVVYASTTDAGNVLSCNGPEMPNVCGAPMKATV